MEKLKHREIKKLAQDDVSNERWLWNLNLDLALASGFQTPLSSSQEDQPRAELSKTFHSPE